MENIYQLTSAQNIMPATKMNKRLIARIGHSLKSAFIISAICSALVGLAVKRTIPGCSTSDMYGFSRKTGSSRLPGTEKLM